MWLSENVSAFLALLYTWDIQTSVSYPYLQHWVKMAKHTCATVFFVRLLPATFLLRRRCECASHGVFWAAIGLVRENRWRQRFSKTIHNRHYTYKLPKAQDTETHARECNSHCMAAHARSLEGTLVICESYSYASCKRRFRLVLQLHIQRWLSSAMLTEGEAWRNWSQIWKFVLQFADKCRSTDTGFDQPGRNGGRLRSQSTAL
jgi:hypothetical protein